MSKAKYPQAVVQYNNLDATRIEFGTPLKNKHGGKFVSVKYRDPADNAAKELVLVVPWLRTPFGVSRFVADNGDVNYNLLLTLDPKQPGADDLRRSLESLHSRMVDEAMSKPKDWCGKPNVIREVAETLCRPVSRPAMKDGEPALDKEGNEYPPNFSLKFPLEKNDTGIFDVEVYRSFKEDPIPVAEAEFDKYISKGAQVCGLVVCSGVWIAGNNSSMVFRASQLKFRAGRARLQSGLIKEVLPDSDDEDDNMDDLSNNADVSSTTAEGETREDTEEEVEEDEEDDEEEVEREPTPPPTPSKKTSVSRGRKRKAETEAPASPAAKR